MAVLLFPQTSLCATDQEEREEEEEEEERDGFLHKHRMSWRRAAAGPSGLLKTHAHHHYHHHPHQQQHQHHQHHHHIVTKLKRGLVPLHKASGIHESSSTTLKLHPQLVFRRLMVKNPNFFILPSAAEESRDEMSFIHRGCCCPRCWYSCDVQDMCSY